MHMQPHKICDPIHGFIRLNGLEKQLLKTGAFQRLRYLRQMGMAYLVYPGATHTRFEHSLGVMEVATRIHNQLLPDADPQIVRLAALCHDLGHLPFSHTAEEVLLGEKGHEKMTTEIIQTLDIPHKQEVLDILNGDSVLSQIIKDDNFGADRIDYLLRDSTYTGVRFGQLDYTHLIDSLRIIDGKIGVHISGIQSVESLWTARYMMYARVYRHPKVCIFSEQMRRFMQTRKVPQTVTAYLKEKDYTILHALEESDTPEAHALLHGEAVLDEEPTIANFEAHSFPVITKSGKVVSSSQVSAFLTKVTPK